MRRGEVSQNMSAGALGGIAMAGSALGQEVAGINPKYQQPQSKYDSIDAIVESFENDYSQKLLEELAQDGTISIANVFEIDSVSQERAWVRY